MNTIWEEKNSTEPKKNSENKIALEFPDTIRKIEKTVYRTVLIENGSYKFPTSKSHKSVKDYTRTPKHKKGFFED